MDIQSFIVISHDWSFQKSITEQGVGRNPETIPTQNTLSQIRIYYTFILLSNCIPGN